MKQPAIWWIALGIIAGIALGSWLPALLGIFGILLTIVCRVPGWLTAGLIIGLLRITASSLDPGPHDISRLAGTATMFSGQVISYPQPRNRSQRMVIMARSDRYHGKVLVSAPASLPLAPGDTIRLSGSLRRPPVFPDFNYRAWLAKDGIHSQFNQGNIVRTGHRFSVAAALYPARRHFSETLTKLIPGQSGAFLQGILIGDRSGISDEVAEHFRRTGTTHVLALSGYNISILTMVLVGMFGRRAIGIWLTMGAIAAFIGLVGPSASVLRAGLMGGFILLGQLLGRPQLALRACLLTAAAMLLVAPWSLRYDLGFDLSFLATLGILLLEAPLRLRLWWIPGLARDAVSATLSATLFSLPVIVLSFGIVSLISPVANALIVPVIPWLMLAGFGTSTLGMIDGDLAAGPAALTGWITGGSLQMLKMLAELPAAALSLNSGRMIAAACGAVASFLIARRLLSPQRD